MKFPKPTKLQLNLISFFAGAILPIAFLPYDWWLVAIISPMILLWTWSDCNYRQIFFRGWLYGLGKYGMGVYWVFISIHHFGGSNIFISSILTLGFVAFLAIFIGLQGLLLRFCAPKDSLYRRIFLFPATWVICEWVYEWILTGFPWLYLGSSQIASPLAGIAPVFGTFGVSFIVVVCAGLLLTTLQAWKKRQALTAYFCLLALLLITVISWTLTQINWTHPTKQSLKVALVQGNTPLLMQWDPHALEGILEKYQRLSAPYWGKADLVVWPENAIPLPLPYAKPYLDKMARIAKAHHSTLMTGNPVPAGINYYNSLQMLGENQGHYYKRHLVPFGEYLPLAPLLRGIINFFNLPMSNFVPGPGQQPLLTVNDISIAPFICYEIAYSYMVRQALPQAGILLTISNDAWFGGSSASWQQLEIGAMQSISAGRPLLAATNDGVTAIIDPKGEMTAVAPRFQTDVLTGTVHAYTGTTPWVAWGNLPILVICFALIVGANYRRRIVFPKR